jgi:hypothetical protein
MLNIVVQLAMGQDVSYRFIPNLGAGGFLLSPLVNSAYDYTQLAFGDIDNLAGNRVVAVRIVGNGAASFAFAPQVDYEFSSLDLSRLTHDAASDALFHAVQAKKSWYDFVQRVGREKSLNGDQMPFQPPDQISFATGAAHRLRIGFGIESAAWREGKTDGVCFSLTSGEQPQPLWTRCLDPVRVAADQGPQTVEVDLAKETSSVTLKAECRVGCDWGWSYLDDVELLQ